jgi:DNA invertase Pin-like site-specific DNA recombinase
MLAARDANREPTLRDGHLVGHARISTDQQDLALQLDALREVCCERVYRDTGSGRSGSAPNSICVWHTRGPATRSLVWRLDRLGRGLKHLIDAIERLHEREIEFRSLTEQIDTTSPSGRLQFHIRGAGRI